MSLTDGFRSIGSGFRSIFASPSLSYEDRYPKMLGTPPCRSWYGHHFVYATQQITCTNCGYHVSTDSLESRVTPCTAWNGHSYASLPPSASDGNEKRYYCTICLSVYAEEST